MSDQTKVYSLAAAMMLGGLPMAGVVQAADTPFVWDGGGGDTNWSTSGNWAPDGAPIASQYQGLNAIDVTGLTSSVVDFAAPVRINELDFGAMGTYTLSGSDLTYTFAPKFTYESSSTITIDNNISFTTGFGNMNSNGTLTFSGDLSGTWGGNLRASSQSLTLAGNNSGLGVNTLFDLQTGATVVLASNTAIGAGVIRIGDNNANSAGIVSASGDRNGIFNLQVNSGSTWVPAAPATRAGRITGSNLTTSGTLDLAYNDTAAQRDQYLRIENTLTEMSGVVEHTSGVLAGKSFHKYGAGTLRFSGTAANTAARTLVVNAGTVEFAKTTAVNAWAADVVVNPGGILKSAATDQGIAGGVSLSGTDGNSATLSITLTGSGATSLNLTGDVDLSTAFDQLSITGEGTIGNGRYVFLTYAGERDGIFDDFQSLGTLPVTTSLDYSQAGEIAVVVVPEPAAAGLIFAAGLIAMSRYRRVRSRRTTTVG